MKAIDYKKIAKDARIDILHMHARANSSHVGSSLSCVDLLIGLYFGVMKAGDRFILSKGHAASALYSVLAQKGVIKKSLLETYCGRDTCLGGHLSRGCVPGVEFSTGSLGHGLPAAAGMALAAKKDNLKHRVFVLLSDGECNEGSVWEAAMFASRHALDNLTAIVDYNKLQGFGSTGDVLNLEPFKAKWQAFGWQAREIDGHDFKKITTALSGAPFKKKSPSIIIAHTIKGKGVSFMENRLEWHYKSPNADQLAVALKELE